MPSRLLVIAILGAGAACAGAPPRGTAAPPAASPALEVMLAEAPCEARLRRPLADHLVPAEGGSGPVLRGGFFIEPGETLCLVADPPAGDLRLAAAPVPISGQKQRLVSLELQTVNGGTLLVVRNHFDRPLRYRAILKEPGKPPAPTSVCVVAASLSAVEHWPHDLEVLSVGAFAFLEAGASAECQ